jgi:Holliday junction resolvase RusA-like endonuclease
MSQSDYIEVTIPALPPGANRTYQPVSRSRSGKPTLVLTKEARKWDAGAALIVGSAAGQFDFEADLAADYEIVIRWWGSSHDADAHLKLVQDTITRKLGFDDRQIKTCVIQRCPDDWGEAEEDLGEVDLPEGVQVHLFRAIKRDWVTELIVERLGLDLRMTKE